MVVSGSQLSELLCLLGAFHPCTLITAAGDGLDERRPADMGDRQPSCRDRRASALRVHAVVCVSVAELHAIIPDRIRR